MVEKLVEIRKIKKEEEEDYLQQDNVTGVDIGYKYVKGKKTDELSIRVYVKHKKNVEVLDVKDIIPKTIKGIKTDVIQREFELHPRLMNVNDLELMNDTGTYDPLQGGISLGPCRSIYCTPPDVDVAGHYIFVGTLGVTVTDNQTDDPMMLSNFHVMCVNNQWNVGDDICQPSRVNGGHCPGDVIGSLHRAALTSSVDCAVARISSRNHECEIVDIGIVNGTATATETMKVRKRGRTTGLTYGIIDTTDLTVKIDYGHDVGEVTLRNQIGIEADPAQNISFGISGDSGSVVVDENTRVVGLYFAGSMEQKDAQGNVTEPAGTYGISNPIQAVLSALDVGLCRKETPQKPPICPIILAASGSALFPHVQFLRAFRDEIVLKSVFKAPFELLLDRYYKFTPLMARKMEEVSAFRKFVKYCMAYPFIMWARGLALLVLAIRAL